MSTLIIFMHLSLVVAHNTIGYKSWSWTVVAMPTIHGGSGVAAGRWSGACVPNNSRSRHLGSCPPARWRACPPKSRYRHTRRRRHRNRLGDVDGGNTSSRDSRNRRGIWSGPTPEWGRFQYFLIVVWKEVWGGDWVWFRFGGHIAIWYL